jgi:membrane protein DedA with SNARE-associated domain
MRLEKFLLPFIATNLPLVCIVGAYFGGDAMLLFLSSLSGQGLIHFWTIILFFSLGTISSDVMWFFIGRTRLAEKLISHKQLNKGYSRIERILTKYGRNDFLLLFIVKFIYGIRIIAIVYFSRERKRFGRFLCFNSIAVVAITVFVSFLGWMAGKGIRSYVDIYENFRSAIKIIVIVLVIFFVLKSLINKWLLKKTTQPQ